MSAELGDTSEDREIPFAYDAKEKVATLQGTDRLGQSHFIVRLVERLDDDSHIATLANAGDLYEFVLCEDAITFTDSSIRIQLPPIELYVDPVYVRKFKAFTRGNVPTPDVAGETLP